VKVGDKARISVDAYPDREIRGVVREIASTALTRNAGTQEEVTNFEVKISIPDRSVRLRPGMSATADIETATVQNVVAVPIQSVTVRTHGQHALARGAGETAARESEARDNEERQPRRRHERERRRSRSARPTREAAARRLRPQRRESAHAEGRDRNRRQHHIEIRSGLKPGDEVVSGSYTAISRKLKDGAKVAIEKEGKK
jgi:HlyD family secretion protein